MTSSAPASQVVMVNQALVMLGTSKTIASMTDPVPAAKIARTIWDQVRDTVLVDHPWNFALSRGTLALSATYTPANEYDFAYELPADCLRWLPWQEDHPDYFLAEQEGAYLLSNAEAPLYARWIVRIEEITRWSQGFRDAMTARLARYLAKAVTGQSGMIDRADAEYERAISAAKRQDGLATGRVQRRAEYRSNWLEARGRRFTGRG